ncbi:hypothetical protein [Enterobacter hormaechei]|uniref:hypothetical protein n=2 Tax=Enterobacter hormaechei TaxID=158836 RepID=UPI00192D13A4|nr:hypothetical protein [Enterobacter hormaechei]MBL6018733.1 hypothetical protein [Enterobacter hormaechei]MBL6023756.1 hypothetical protein [Enterobacter hormaechei]MBL6053711.1 hypothetical protein [Enterobacter hormaechei]MBL6058724.1 hypothetical protein [Enterobacter hormaechei]MBL6063735.1 hypothetical protein [Enterobacter hormaechei]
MTNKTKELVAAGHALAKELHCAESAALVRELATQLDVQLARSNALAAENAGLKAEHELALQYMEELRANFSMYKKFKCNSESGVDTPATDAFLAELRAQGAEECVRQLVISDDDDFSDAPNICAMVAHQLRQEAQ